MGSNVNWKPEEIEYLENHWGTRSLDTIAEGLGRSASGVNQKAQRLGLGDPLLHLNGITINALSAATNIEYGLIRNWIKKYDFPVKRKKLTAKKWVMYVMYDDFWEWAEANKQMIDFSKFDRHTLAPEPDWVEKKRAADFKKKAFLPKPHNTPWSSKEIGQLKYLVEKGTFTYPDMSRILQRSHGAIKRKLSELGIMYRPEYLENHHKYTKDEIELMETMLEDGHSIIEIATILKRSEAGVRGKIERMGFKFKNGVPYK